MAGSHLIPNPPQASEHLLPLGPGPVFAFERFTATMRHSLELAFIKSVMCVLNLVGRNSYKKFPVKSQSADE